MCPISGKEERDAGRWYSSGKLGLTSVPQGVRRYFCYTVLLVMLSVEEIPLSFFYFHLFLPFSFSFFSISHSFLFHFSPFPLLVSSPFNYILYPFFLPVLIALSTISHLHFLSITFSTPFFFQFSFPSLPFPTSTSFPTLFAPPSQPVPFPVFFSLSHLFSTSFHHFSITVKFRK